MVSHLNILKINAAVKNSDVKTPDHDLAALGTRQ
jgi:hypothetical protein